MYSAQHDEAGKLIGIIYSGSDDIKFIPLCDGNRDYQEYLAWVEQGNQPVA